MAIDDDVLPAAVHLTGPGAADVLTPVVAAMGGELLSCRVGQVQYRPGSDLVVAYRCEIRTGTGIDSVRLYAGTTVAGPHSGTLPVVAEAPDGTELSVGVWRWPFDPLLPALAGMVTPQQVVASLSDVMGQLVALDVVAFRPTERAVIRVTGSRRTLYVKVVPPAATGLLQRRHTALRDGRVPAPRVVAVGDGWVAMEAIDGTTLRDRLKSGQAALVDPSHIADLLDRLAHVSIDGAPPVRSRVDDAVHHGAMLAAVLPPVAPSVERILAAIACADSVATDSPNADMPTIHGDLHEAQLVVDDRSVTGVLDIDDAGPGHRLDDVATLVAHLRARALWSHDERIDGYADAVLATVGRNRDPVLLERRIAAVTVGLATGPFRLQQAGWESPTERLLEQAELRLARVVDT